MKINNYMPQHFVKTAYGMMEYSAAPDEYEPQHKLPAKGSDPNYQPKHSRSPYLLTYKYSQYSRDYEVPYQTNHLSDVMMAVVSDGVAAVVTPDTCHFLSREEESWLEITHGTPYKIWGDVDVLEVCDPGFNPDTITVGNEILRAAGKRAIMAYDAWCSEGQPKASIIDQLIQPLFSDISIYQAFISKVDTYQVINHGLGIDY